MGIDPFWRRFGTFLAVPLHMGPLILLALAAAGGVVAGLSGGLGLVLRGIVVFAAIRFAFQVFDHFSGGNFNVDSPDIVTWPPSDPRAAKQGLVLVVYFLLLAGVAVVSVKPRPPVVAAQTPAVQAETALERQNALPAGVVAEDREEAVGDDEDVAADSPSVSPGSDPSATQDVGVQFDDPVANDRDSAGLSLADLPAWFWLVAVLFAIPLPAAALVLALEHSIIKALNPLHTMSCLRAMGGGYFILLGFFAFIVAVRFGIVAASKNLPLAVAYPIEGVAIAYLTIVLYAMLGYVACQYHDELGLSVSVSFAQQKEKAEAADLDPLERKLRTLLADGRVDQAIDTVLDEMRYARLDVALNRRLHALYLQKGNNDLTLKHGQQFLTALLADGQGDEALALLAKLEAIAPAFAPSNEKLLLPLAEAAFRARQADKALSLIKGFDRRYPGHDHIPAVYFLGARLCSEFLRNDSQAMLILKTLLSRHPEADCAAEAKSYLAVLENMAGMARPVLDGKG